MKKITETLSPLSIFFCLTSIVFMWLYLCDKPLADKWKVVVAKSKEFRNESEERSIQSKLSSNAFTDPHLADKYIKEYKRYIATGAAPTENVWVTDKMICALVNFLVCENKEEETDGARLYFARYPKYIKGEDPIRDSPHGDAGNYDNRNTLVFVATKKVFVKGTSSGLHQDYFRKYSSTKLTGETYDGLYNYHDLCPPATANCSEFNPDSGNKTPIKN